MENDSEAGFQTHTLKMFRAMVFFRAGLSACIGNNTSLLEIYEIIPRCLGEH